MDALVSVCIPTFNQSLYLEKAVRSAWNQDKKPDEIIVYNDASTDDTVAVLERLVTEIPVLTFFTQPVNKGISENDEGCLRAATSKYIVRLDSDDFIHFNYISKIVKALEENAQAGYGHCAVQEIDDNDNPTRIRQLARKEGFESADKALEKSISGYRVAANILTYRKKCLEELSFNRGRPNYTEDYHLSVSMAAAGYGNVYIDEVFASYRIWIDAGLVRQKRKLLEISGLYIVFNKAIIPAFEERSWSTERVYVKMGEKARRQASCLGWSTYSSQEKGELLTSLKKLSNSTYSQIVYNLYLNGYGRSFNFIQELKDIPKRVAKKLIYTLRK